MRPLAIFDVNHLRMPSRWRMMVRAASFIGSCNLRHSENAMLITRVRLNALRLVAPRLEALPRLTRPIGTTCHLARGAASIEQSEGDRHRPPL
jgi:hypothetical protein